MADYNSRLAIEAQRPEDAHRPVLHIPDELNLIFSLHHTRTLSKNLSFQFKNQAYPLQGQGQGYRLRGARVTLCEPFKGEPTVLYQNTVMPYRRLARGEAPIPLDDEKSIHHTLDQAKRNQAARPNYKPAPDHPWRKGTAEKERLSEAILP